MVEALDENESLAVERLVVAGRIQDGVFRIDSQSDDGGRIKLVSTKKSRKKRDGESSDVVFIVIVISLS